MSTSFEKEALSLYKPPFRHEAGYIFDRDGNMVADESGHVLRVRGKDFPRELQDATGELIARAMTKYWNAMNERVNIESRLRPHEAYCPNCSWIGLRSNLYMIDGQLQGCPYCKTGGIWGTL